MIDSFLKIIIFFAGSIASLLISIFMTVGKRESIREYEKKKIEEKGVNVGDVYTYLNHNPNTRKIKHLDLFAERGLLPLFILSLIYSFNSISFLNVLFSLCMFLFIHSHEHYLSERYSSNKYYQIIIITVWILFSIIILVDNKII